MPESLRFVILGHMSRSGSTFLTLLMDAHPEIVATPEAHFPPSMLDARARLVTLDTERTVRRYVRAAADDEKLSAWDLDWDEVADRAVAKHGLPLPAPSLFPVVLERYAASREPAARWVVYKSNGRAVQHVRRLLDTFPEVRLLWLVRDPRAAAASSMRARDPTHGLRLVGDPRGFGAVWAHQAATLARAKGARPCAPGYVWFATRIWFAIRRPCSTGSPDGSGWRSSIPGRGPERTPR